MGIFSDAIDSFADYIIKHEKKIRCTNCGYIGKPKKVEKFPLAHWVWLSIFILSFYWTVLFIVSILMLIWLIFQRRKIVCPKCGYPNTIPIDPEHYRMNHK
jgi:DNA-directed RNA polymerase subunit RPC12/RpoP